MDLVQVTVDVISCGRGIQILSVLFYLFFDEVSYVLVDVLHCLVWPRQTAHQARKRVVKLWREAGGRMIPSFDDQTIQIMPFLSLLKRTYLCTNGGFDPETTAKRAHQFFETFVAVFKSMTEHQGADDVGDDVVEHEMRSKGPAYSCR